jgi:hypothetical protein
VANNSGQNSGAIIAAAAVVIAALIGAAATIITHRQDEEPPAQAAVPPAQSPVEKVQPTPPQSTPQPVVPLVPPVKHQAMGPLEHATNRQGDDFDAFGKSTQNEYLCAEMCRQEPDCKAMTFVISQKTCWLKTSVPPATSNSDMISSVKVGAGEAQR